MTETSLNTLLDGRVKIHQPVTGYRAGMDAVMLAASLAARPGEHLVEFGCGSGAALLCAARRLDDASFSAFEIDPVAADLARRNVVENGLEGRVQVMEADIAALTEERMADQVFFNPPFFDDPAALRLPKAEKQRAWLSGHAPLPVWIKSAARALRSKGYLTVIHRADALPAILAALDREFGSFVIKPIQAKAGQPAKRVIVKARKGGRASAVLLESLILHDDGKRVYSPAADAIMHGSALVLDA